MDYLNKVRAEVRQRIVSIDSIRDGLAGGEVDQGLYIRYLTNVWHYAQHSSIVIGLAGSRCVPSNEALASYLLHHAQDELGHDQWALDDLAALGIDEATVRASRPVSSCAAMIGYEYYIAAHANPVGLFGWLFVLEAMGEDLGHIVAQQVSQALDLPDGVRFLAGHGDADEDHTREIIEQIETNIRGEDLEFVHHVADVMGDLYVGMFEQIGQS